MYHHHRISVSVASFSTSHTEGKTSLLNLLDGEAVPSSGKVIRHLGSRVARLQQHHYKGEQLDPNLTALEHMRRLPQVSG